MLIRAAGPAVALCAWLFACLAHAQTTQPLRLLAQAATEQDLSLLERVLGQLSDLPAMVEVRIINARGLDARAQAARAALQTRQVDGVLWLADLPGKKLLFLSRPDQEPLLAARMPVGEDGELASSDQELAALVVRSSVQAMAAGEMLPHVAQSLDEHPTPPSPPATPQDSKTRLHLQGMLAAQEWIDGSGTVGRSGGLLQVEALWGLLRVGAEGSLSWRKHVQAALGDIRIARHDVSAVLGAQVPTPWVSVALGAHSGAALYVRTTRSNNQQLSATGRRTTPAFFAGPDARASWSWGAIGVAIMVALDVMPGPPTFKYAGGSALQSTVYKPPVLAARVALGLQVRML